MRRYVEAVLKDAERDVEVTYREELDSDMSQAAIEFVWREGNLSCDCNRAMYLARIVPGYDGERSCCGDKIELVSLHIVNGETP
jgi:hypothetical protein